MNEDDRFVLRFLKPAALGLIIAVFGVALTFAYPDVKAFRYVVAIGVVLGVIAVFIGMVANMFRQS